jgi:HEAT repeat protein
MLDLDTVDEYTKALGKGDDTLRRQAIHFLKERNERDWETAPVKVIRSLVDSLRHQLLNGMKQAFFRHDVVTILGNMGSRSEPAVPQLVELLAEEMPDGLREAAAIALGKIGKKAVLAVEPLINLLAHGRTNLAVQGVRALGDIGCADQRVRAALINLWLSSTQSKNGQVQVAIALCKLKIDAMGLASFLTSTLVANQDASLRKSAAEGLAWRSKNEVDVVPALFTAARNDKDEKVRQAAQAGLARLRLTEDKAVHLCSKQLKESSYAEAALRKSGVLAVPALIEALGTQEGAIREKAARILGTLGESAAPAVPALTRVLHDKDPLVRLAVAKGLWNITKDAQVVVPVMVTLLSEKWAAASDAGESRRKYLQTVIEALQRIGPSAKAAISALTEKAKDKNRHISESALSALKEIAPAVVNKWTWTIRRA